MNNNQSDDEGYRGKAEEIFSRLGAKDDLEKIKKQEGKPSAEPEAGVGPSEANHRLRRVLEIGRAISSILDLDQLLERILDSAIELTGAERGILFLYSEKVKELKVDIARNNKSETIGKEEFSISKSIVATVDNKREPLLITDARQDPTFSIKKSIIEFNIHSILCVPMIFRDKYVGVIYIDSRLEKHLFSKKDQELLMAFAAQAAVSIENAASYKKVDEMRHALEEKVSARTKELENKISELKTFHDAAVGRELKMIELEKEVDGLKGKIDILMKKLEEK